MPDLRDWVKRFPFDKTKVYCKYCKILIRSRRADLIKHAKRKTHNRHRPSLIEVPIKRVRTSYSESPARKKIEKGRVALFRCVHTNMKCCDHLYKIFNSVLHKSIAVSFERHRTEYTDIISNIIWPHFQKELRKDIGDAKFSLIIDELTDISVTKVLCVVIRYYSAASTKILTRFLELVELKSGTEEAVVHGIKTVAAHFELNLKNLVCLGIDNTPSTTRMNNGVFSKLKDELHSPHLVLVGCVYHPLQAAVFHAIEETLPMNLDFLVRETYNWFSYSSIRQLTYETLYSAINYDKKPLKMLPLYNTHWILIEPALNAILNQWQKLKEHFKTARQKEKCYMAEQLYNNFENEKNRVYLLYLQKLLNDVQRVNRAFKPGRADLTRLFRDLQTLLGSVSAKILDPTAEVDILRDKIVDYLNPNPHMGRTVEEAFQNLRASDEEKKKLRRRCIHFTLKLFEELQSRLPSNLKLLEKLHLLHPTDALQITRRERSFTDLVKTLVDDPKKITEIEKQWHSLAFVKWNNIQTSEEFWVEVAGYRNSSDQHPFIELASLALGLLSLPHSNADVEQIFSQMNIVKTKLRNRLKLKTVNSILFIRHELKRRGKCCYTYDLPQNVVNRIGTTCAYERSQPSTSASISVITDEEILNEEEENILDQLVL